MTLIDKLMEKTKKSPTGNEKDDRPTSAAPAASAAVGQPGRSGPVAAGEKKPKLGLGEFEIKQTLGTGSFGRVHLVRYRSTGKYHAMKVLKKAEVVKHKQVEHTLNEKNILEQIDHPFLVGLFATFQDCANLYMVLEYITGGELFTYLRRSQVRFYP
jgi:serine/threonine protein kinase